MYLAYRTLSDTITLVFSVPVVGFIPALKHGAFSSHFRNRESRRGSHSTPHRVECYYDTLGTIIGGTGAIPRRSRRGYAPSQWQFPTVFVPKQRMCKHRGTGYDHSVAEWPKSGGSSVRPHWKQGRVCPDVGITHQALGKYSQRKSLRVRRSLPDSPWPTQHWESESDNGEERSPGVATPLPGDCPVTSHSPIPTVCWLGSLQP